MQSRILTRRYCYQSGLPSGKVHLVIMYENWIPVLEIVVWKKTSLFSPVSKMLSRCKMWYPKKENIRWSILMFLHNFQIRWICAFHLHWIGTMLHHKLFIPAGVRHHLSDILQKYVNGSYFKIPQIVYSHGLAGRQPTFWFNLPWPTLSQYKEKEKSGNG